MVDPDSRDDPADPEITLQSSDGGTEAKFVPSANMVCASLRYRGAEFLHPGRGLRAYAERGKTMGIPLLYPWANRLAGFEYTVAGKHVVLPKGTDAIPVDPAGRPIHGVLPSLMRWEVEELRPDACVARLHWDSAELLALFPFRHELTVEVRIDDGRVDLATTVRPTASDCVPVSFGYHPYLQSPNVPRERWLVTIAARERLILDERKIPTGERELFEHHRLELRDVSFDDAFGGLTEPAAFVAAADEATVRVEFLRGFPYAQIYAPAGSDFICFEPMTAATNAVNSGEGLRIVEPGEEHSAAFTISITART
jgi:galactose mutarotase-like enzyme